jgi:hypothetical protein
MPLTLNVGLSRKVGEPDYGSRGASVNLELELDGTVIDDPERLRDRIRHLFGLAQLSVDEELSGSRQPASSGNGNGHHGNGHGNGSHSNGGTQPSIRGATQSQVRAIHAVADRRHLNLPQLLQQRFGVELPQQLSLKDASSLLDEFNGKGERSAAAR